MELSTSRTRTFYLSGALIKALLLGSLCTFLLSAALFPALYAALRRYIIDAPPLHTYPVPLLLWDVGTFVLRILLACGVGLFFHKRLNYVDKPDEVETRSRLLLFGVLFGLWCIYLVSDSLQTGVVQAASYITSLGASFYYTYTDGPLGLPFLCETVLNPWSLFAFLACWACLLLPAGHRGKEDIAPGLV